MNITMHDKMKLEGDTLVSCRDGFMIYQGSELGGMDGIKGLDSKAMYKIYRSPKLISSINLVGVPITDGHVDLERPFTTYGSVTGQEILKKTDSEVDKTIEVRNSVSVCDDLQRVIDAGKNELSLGYSTKMVDRRDDDSDYDFEQVDIIPNHLAVVDAGRCGSCCTFDEAAGEVGYIRKTIDQLDKTAKVWKDAARGENSNANDCECSPTEQKPHIEDKMDIKTYTQAKDALTAIIGLIATFDAAEVETLQNKMRMAGQKKETDDEMKTRLQKEKDEEEMKVKTDKEKKQANDKALNDTVAKLVDERVKTHSDVLSKVVEFGMLADDYKFSDKSTLEIMKDCVKEQHETEFTDAEIPTVFKTLRKAVDNVTSNLTDADRDYAVKQSGEAASFGAYATADAKANEEK